MCERNVCVCVCVDAFITKVNAHNQVSVNVCVCLFDCRYTYMYKLCLYFCKQCYMSKTTTTASGHTL